ncbi:MAG: twin-arginine translocation signal domain-containing protein [Chloroflexota bacterium]|nr:twin-arginine translocation signal domain-containing protein [Chloroflexota bacterium]MDE2841373.1 twin-arginine translocation signal domain-containing protein [Chloroflexota bacterium]MDE2931022.1 twin-arginine translocation signal domain-containing protein [Chloroflexota bacterium]
MRTHISRRTFLGGSAVAGAGLLLAACGTAPAAPVEEAPAAPEKKEAEAPKMDEATEIKYLHFSTQSDVWDNAYDGMFAAFEEMHPGLKLNVAE